MSALEGLLRDAGYQTKIALKTAYTRRWLEGTLGEMVVFEGREPK
jgi:hypothetical protein